MFPRLRRFAADRLEAYLNSGPKNVSRGLALSMRRARGFSLIGQGVLIGGAAVGAMVGVPKFVVLSAFSMLAIAANVRLGAMANGRYFPFVTHCTMAVMLAGTIATSIDLGYASPFGVMFSILIIMSANYILGTRAAIFWTGMSIAGVSYQLLTSEPIPFPPEAIQPSLIVSLVTRIVVLAGTCAIAVAERSFSDRQSRELEVLASHDSLTGLLNRRAFQARLRDSLARARRHGRRIGIVFLDLDEFKQVNDRHGHAIGDSVLQRVGRQIAAMTRKGDAAARTGGDEFVMLLEDVDEAKDIRKLAERILMQIHGGVDLSMIPEWSLAVSIGAACYPDDAEDADALMHAADQAMYRAKRGGGGGVASLCDAV
jgi:diguanylate cyclase (GGDEF)-like protein